MTKRSGMTQEHEIFRKSLRKFLEKFAKPHLDEWEENKEIPKSFWRKLGNEGYLCPYIGEEYGGLEADFWYSVIIDEELERLMSGFIGISLHNDIVVPYINTFGTEQQKEKWLPKCVTGEYITAIAMTEPGAGSDLANIKTTAKKEGDHYILNGEKTFITNGIFSDLVIVAVKTDTAIRPTYKGISLLVVERDTPGFKRGKKLDKIGLHSQDTAELIFEDALVPVGNLLGEEGKGFYYLMEKLQQERLIVAICAQISSEVMIEETIKFVKNRKAFGKSVGQFQNTQFKIAEMVTDTVMSKSFLYDLIEQHIDGLDVVTSVSMAKWKITDTAKKIAAECMQLHGGYGYMEEYSLARRYRDIPVMSIYAGSNEIMKVIIAKNLGLD